MRTKLILLCFLFSTLLTAQVNNLPTVLNINGAKEKSTAVMFGVVPASLSYDGTNRIYIRTADDQVAIYGSSFTPVKQFNISPNYEGYQYRKATREVTVTVTGGELIKENLVIETWSDKNLVELYLNCSGAGDCERTYKVPDSWTNDDIIDYLENGEVGYNVSKITSTKPYPDGGTMFIWDMEAFHPDGSENLNYWEAKKYGKKYPRVFFLWKDGYLYYCSNTYYSDESEYSEKKVSFSYGDWKETGEVSQTTTDLQTWGVGFVNFDNDHLNCTTEDGDALCLTQTLFNNDAQYEYLHFPISSYVMSKNNGNNPICNDCYPESTTFTESASVFCRAAYSGFEVMSDNGNSLQSVSFPSGFVMIGSVNAQIIKLSNEYYLICTGEMNDKPTMLVYKINRDNGNGIPVQQIGEPMRIAAYPNPAGHSQTVTIQLTGSNAGKTQTELQVTNLQGQTIDRRTIPAGQQQTTIPAHNLASGLNLINIQQKGQTVGTGKVIVQ